LKAFQFLEPVPWFWFFVGFLTFGLWLLRSKGRKRKLAEVFERGGKLDVQLKQQSMRLFVGQLFKVFGFICLCIALMRPVWNPKQIGVEQSGRDLIFVLDVSRSMLAKDCRPNRLEVAKAAIEQCLKSKRGDRYALLAFAGSASIRCPLTRDQRFFRKMLNEISPDSVAQGGTRIEDALTKVVDKLLLDDGESTARDLILISDGEDLGSKPERSVNKLNALSVRMLVIGLGDADYGERIPNVEENGYVTYKGKEVWTRHRPDALRALTNLSNQGVFFPIGTGALNLEVILEQLSHAWPGQAREQAKRTVYDEGYPYIIALGMLFWLLAMVLEVNWSFLARQGTLAILLLVGWLDPNSGYASNLQLNPKTEMVEIEELEELPEAMIQPLKAQAAITKKNWVLAERILRRLLDKAYQPKYELDLAFVLHKKKSYEEASHYFESASRNSNNRNLVIQSRYNAGCSMIQWAFELEELWLNPELDEEELEEMMTPEEVFQRAIDEFRIILRENPQHEKAAWNLAWLINYLYAEEDQDQDQNQQQQQRQQEGDQEKSDEESEGEDQESEEEQEGDSDNEGQPSDKNPSGDRMLKTSQLSLPPPAASPEEILAQEQQNQLKREKGKSGERAKVEKDW
jgi:hypothetical protein